MLIKCPECLNEISDKALTCPRCGFPMNQGTNISPKVTKKAYRASKKRLPNGFGRITKINSKQLRNPYRVTVTVGKDENGKYIGKTLRPKGYFATYNEAYAALVEYNQNPYDLNDDITVKEMYERWFEEYKRKLKSASSERTIVSAWNKCEPIYNLRVKEVRARHIKACMDTCESANLKSRVKSLCNLMFDYALEYELVDRNYARTFDIAKEISEEIKANKKDHVSFSEDELKALWSNRNIDYVDMVLVQCYSGFRPQELCKLKRENINLEKRIMIGGMKTDAGTNRVVPIHPSVYEIVKYNYDKGTDTLFVGLDDGLEISYDKYRRRFQSIIKRLRLDPLHKPHDPRKTFITLAKKYNVDEYAIKRIVGHSIQDITEATYTDRDIDWLLEEVKKIKAM